MKQKSKANEFMDKIAEIIQEYKMPSILVMTNPSEESTGIVMDAREETMPLNKALLMDAMITQANFMNLVFDAVATLIALSPAKMHKEFEAYIRKVREMEEKSKHHIINNTAEA